MAADEPKDLPSWMVGPAPYEPPRDRDGYLRKNVLRLASTLTVLRAEGAPANPVDRALARVGAPARLLGLIVLVLLTSLAHNLAFVWVLLAVTLTLLSLRPAEAIAAIIVPALVAATVAALVNLPAALFMGQTTAPVRVGAKTLANLLVVGSVARTTTPEDLLGGLTAIGLPAIATATIDAAIRDLALIGEEASTLASALELRSVGKNREKTAGVAGVLGTCFLKAMRHGREQADAMRLRGYDGTQPRTRQTYLTPYTFAYLLAVSGLVALFLYLEAAL